MPWRSNCVWCKSVESKSRSIVNKISKKLENGEKVNKNSMTMWIFKYIQIIFYVTGACTRRCSNFQDIGGSFHLQVDGRLSLWRKWTCALFYCEIVSFPSLRNPNARLINRNLNWIIEQTFSTFIVVAGVCVKFIKLKCLNWLKLWIALHSNILVSVKTASSQIWRFW